MNSKTHIRAMALAVLLAASWAAQCDAADGGDLPPLRDDSEQLPSDDLQKDDMAIDKEVLPSDDLKKDDIAVDRKTEEVLPSDDLKRDDIAVDRKTEEVFPSKSSPGGDINVSTKVEDRTSNGDKVVESTKEAPQTKSGSNSDGNVKDAVEVSKRVARNLKEQAKELIRESNILSGGSEEEEGEEEEGVKEVQKEVKSISEGSEPVPDQESSSDSDDGVDLSKLSSCPIQDGISNEEREDFDACLPGCAGHASLVNSIPYYGQEDEDMPVKITKHLSSLAGDKHLYMVAIADKDAIPSLKPLLEKVESTYCQNRASQKAGGGCLLVAKRYSMELPEEESYNESTGLVNKEDDYCKDILRISMEPEMASDLTTRTLDDAKFGQGSAYVVPSVGYFISTRETDDDMYTSFWVLWPYYENEDLRKYRNKKIDSSKLPNFLNKVAYEGCLALAHTHEMGWVHRDVKPDNFFVDADGHALLADFDLSARLATSSQQQGTPVEALWADTACEFVGTRGYLAPELLGDCKKSINAKSVAQNNDLVFARDMWAFGETLLSLSGAKLTDAGKKFGEDAAWLTVARGSLEKDPAKRMTAARCAEHMVTEWRDKTKKPPKLVTDLVKKRSDKAVGVGKKAPDTVVDTVTKKTSDKAVGAGKKAPDTVVDTVSPE